MEGKKDRVTYTVTIKGDDGSEEVIFTQNYLLCAIRQDGGIDCHRRLQAKPYELLGLYAGLMNQKEDLEQIDKLLPALYAIGEMKELTTNKENVSMDGGVV